MKIKIILLTMMLLMSMAVIVSASPPNSMGFTEPKKDVTVGTTFYSHIYGDISSPIDTIAVDNLTYLPAGILTHSSLNPTQTKGNILNVSNDENYTTVFLRPTANISDASGYENPWVWAWNTITVNNINATAFNTRWIASNCGIVTLTITAGGTALGGIDPGTTKYVQIVSVHPMVTTDFDAEPHNTTVITMDWTKHTGDDKSVIRYKPGSNPTSVTDGTLLYNSTGTSTTHSGLTPGQHVYYSAWGWNETAGLYSLTYQTDDATTTVPNSPPTFGTPSPTNGSIGRPLSLTWSIPINDPDGNVFNWSIACSNGHGTSATGESNGTKAFLFSGLAYSTTYTVWVNATDPAGSGLYTRRWYQFTTVANQPPAIPGGTDMTPHNGAPNVPVYVGFLRVLVTDPESQTMSVAFYWGNSTLIGTATSVVSGTTATIAIPILAYNTTYLWYVSINDNHGGITRGPTVGNWSYTTGAYVPIPPGGPGVHTHTLFVTVVDDATNLPIVNALCKITKGTDVQGQGLTTIYGTFSKLLKDSDQYTLTVTANGYVTSVTQFTLSQKDTYITIRMHAGITPVGLTNAQGGLTTLGFVFLAILIATLLGVLFLWYNYYGGKKR